MGRSRRCQEVQGSAQEMDGQALVRPVPFRPIASASDANADYTSDSSSYTVGAVSAARARPAQQQQQLQQQIVRPRPAYASATVAHRLSDTEALLKDAQQQAHYATSTDLTILPNR